VDQVELGGQLVADAVREAGAHVGQPEDGQPGGQQAVRPRVLVLGVPRAVRQVRGQQAQRLERESVGETPDSVVGTAMRGTSVPGMSGTANVEG
jgi:hypothetical protein